MKAPSQKQQAIAEQQQIAKEYETVIPHNPHRTDSTPIASLEALANRQKAQIMAIKEAALKISELDNGVTVQIDRKQWMELESAINRAEPVGYSCVARTVIPV